MPRPRREEFISDVRLSARMLQKPNVEADSDALEPPMRFPGYSTGQPSG